MSHEEILCVTQRVPERQFAAKVNEDINKFAPGEGEATVVMLRSKLGDFDSPIRDEHPFCQIFVYDKSKKSMAKEVMRGWIELIDGQHFFLPPMTVTYFMAKMPAQRLAELYMDSSTATEENLVKAITKTKEVGFFFKE